MKISSHPELMSRRAALASIGAGLTTLLQWPADIRAHERRIPEFSFIVVSDTHLGRNDRSEAADLWTKTAAEIDKAPGEFVLHIGDVVDAGRCQCDRPAHTGTFSNRWLGGVKAGGTSVCVEPSWLDGQPCFVMQYPPDAPIFGNVRDELRQIQPGVWLGRSYEGVTGEPKNWFVLKGR